MFLGSTPMPMPIMIPTPSGGSSGSISVVEIVICVVLTVVSGWFANLFAYTETGLDREEGFLRKPALAVGIVPYLLAVVVVIWGAVAFFVSQWRKE